MSRSIALGGIKNIIFDFGGVLFEIDYHLPVKAFQQLGFEAFDQLYTQAMQRPEFDLLETGKITNEAFLEFLGGYVKSATKEEILQAWNCILLKPLCDEIRHASKLRQLGYRTFLLSNTNAIHVEVFGQMIRDAMPWQEFQSGFEKVYYSNAIGIKKPYPETFLQVCEWNGLDPKETLFIDDSIQHVEGARKAGLHAHHLLAGEKISELLRLDR
jgi:putative hydrolase of the HAD superfamily